MEQGLEGTAGGGGVTTKCHPPGRERHGESVPSRVPGEESAPSPGSPHSKAGMGVTSTGMNQPWKRGQTPLLRDKGECRHTQVCGRHAGHGRVQRGRPRLRPGEEARSAAERLGKGAQRREEAGQSHIFRRERKGRQAERILASIRFLALKTSPISYMMMSSLVLPSPSK